MDGTASELSEETFLSRTLIASELGGESSGLVKDL
jgi:hypothetical protein